MYIKYIFLLIIILSTTNGIFAQDTATSTFSTDENITIGSSTDLIIDSEISNTDLFEVDGVNTEPTDLQENLITNTQLIQSEKYVPVLNPNPFNVKQPPIWSLSKVMLNKYYSYKATSDVKYLQDLNNMIAQAMNATGDVANKRDDVRRNISKAWPIGYYTTSNYSSAVEAAIILYPTLMFVEEVKDNPNLHKMFLENAEEYERRSIEILNYFKPELRKNGVKYYYVISPQWKNISCTGNSAQIKKCNTFKKSAGKILPHNMNNSMGMVHAQLYAINPVKYKIHGEISKRIYATFRSSLSTSKYGGYHWLYWEGGRKEDMSHAALSALFVDVMHRNFPTVVTKAQAQKFAKTFTKNLIRGKSLTSVKKTTDIAMYTDGTSYAGKGDIQSCPYFMVLASVAPDTVKVCNHLYDKFKYPKSSHSGLFSAFKLN